MSTTGDNPTRHFQFSLARLLVAVVIAACFLGLWFADPPGTAILITICLSFVIPPCAVTAAFCSRGYTRSFFIGMGVLQFFQIAFNLFLFWIVVVELEIDDSEAIWEFMQESRDDMAWPDLHRYQLFIFVLSSISGLLSIGVHWLLRNQASSD